MRDQNKGRFLRRVRRKNPHWSKLYRIPLLLLCLGALFAAYRVSSLIADSFLAADELPKRASAISSQQGTDALPAELQTLLEKNPETRDFVLGYSSRTAAPVDISGDVQEGGVPHFLQWDTRWGYQSYGSGMIATTGCGPTCLSMVVTGLTGDLSWHPGRVAEYSEENGHYMPGTGTAWTLMSEGAGAMGVRGTELPLEEQVMRSHLEQSRPIICSVGPGDFTDAGHFIVLSGLTADGGFRVLDPNSKELSGKSWDYARLAAQIRNLWTYTLL